MADGRKSVKSASAFAGARHAREITGMARSHRSLANLRFGLLSVDPWE